MALPSFITGNLWKIGTIGAGIIAVVLVALLMASNFENASLIRQRDELSIKINDPVTGYVAQLSQARTNVATLTTQINRVRTELQTQAAAANVQLRATEARLAAVQATNRAMDLRLRQFMSRPPQGTTLEDRIRDIDNRANEEFLK